MREKERGTKKREREKESETEATEAAAIDKGFNGLSFSPTLLCLLACFFCASLKYSFSVRSFGWVNFQTISNLFRRKK